MKIIMEINAQITPGACGYDICQSVPDNCDSSF